MIALETLVYALQIASLFFLAAPVLIRAERRRSLARNPAWVDAHPDFLARHGTPGTQASVAVGIILLPLLAAAGVLGSRPYLFLVHVVAFGVAVVTLLAWCGWREAKVRRAIPEETVRRASWQPRTWRSLVPGWALAILASAMATALAVNGWGWLSGSMAPARAAGNAAYICLSCLGMGLVIRYVIGRASLRLSASTDAAGRSLELSLALGTSLFLAAGSLYYSFGSIGPDPLFAYPPTLIHARIEGQPWSWALFFARPEYRWVEMAASLVIASLGPWLAMSPYHQRLLEVDLRQVRSASEV